MRVTISLPCFGRPQRTRRAIQCILNQDLKGWEAFVMGDNCPHFQKMIDSGEMEQFQWAANLQGNKLHYFNAKENGGGHGYKLTNHAIQNATGKYLVFFANDDVILPNHLSNYLEIEKHPDIVMMYFDSFLDPVKKPRISHLGFCQIGHSEIIVKTDIAKKCKPHSEKYGHDWDFISEVMSMGKCVKSTSSLQTYHVMHIPSIGCSDIID